MEHTETDGAQAAPRSPEPQAMVVLADPATLDDLIERQSQGIWLPRPDQDAPADPGGPMAGAVDLTDWVRGIFHAVVLARVHAWLADPEAQVGPPPCGAEPVLVPRPEDAPGLDTALEAGAAVFRLGRTGAGRLAGPVEQIAGSLARLQQVARSGPRQASIDAYATLGALRLQPHLPIAAAADALERQAARERGAADRAAVPEHLPVVPVPDDPIHDGPLATRSKTMPFRRKTAVPPLNLVNDAALDAFVAEHSDTAELSDTLRDQLPRLVRRQIDRARQDPSDSLLNDRNGFVRVKAPRPDDPDWVAARLAEGAQVQRFEPGQTMDLEADISRVADGLAALERLAAGPAPQAARRAARLLRTAETGPLGQVIDGADELEEQATDEQLMMRAGTPVAEPFELTARDGTLLRRVTTHDALHALGDRMENCLSRRRRGSHKELWRDFMRGRAALFEMRETRPIERLLGLVAIDLDRGVITQMAGHANSALPVRLAPAIEDLLETLGFETRQLTLSLSGRDG